MARRRLKARRALISTKALLVHRLSAVLVTRYPQRHYGRRTLIPSHRSARTHPLVQLATAPVHSVAFRDSRADHRPRHPDHQERKQRDYPHSRASLTRVPPQATVQLNNHFYSDSRCVPSLFEIATSSPNVAVSLRSILSRSTVGERGDVGARSAAFPPSEVAPREDVEGQDVARGSSLDVRGTETCEVTPSQKRDERETRRRFPTKAHFLFSSSVNSPSSSSASVFRPRRTSSG